MYDTVCPLEYERVYLPLCKVADTPFHIQDDDFMVDGQLIIYFRSGVHGLSLTFATRKYLCVNYGDQRVLSM